MRVLGLILLGSGAIGTGVGYTLFVIRQQQARRSQMRELRDKHEQEVEELNEQIRYWSNRLPPR